MSIQGSYHSSLSSPLSSGSKEEAPKSRAQSAQGGGASSPVVQRAAQAAGNALSEGEITWQRAQGQGSGVNEVTDRMEGSAVVEENDYEHPVQEETIGNYLIRRGPFNELDAYDVLVGLLDFLDENPQNKCDINPSTVLLEKRQGLLEGVSLKEPGYWNRGLSDSSLHPERKSDFAQTRNDLLDIGITLYEMLTSLLFCEQEQDDQDVWGENQEATLKQPDLGLSDEVIDLVMGLLKPNQQQAEQQDEAHLGWIMNHPWMRSKRVPFTQPSQGSSSSDDVHKVHNAAQAAAK